ncbi:MAG: zinc-binding dehydrogenase, partial [Pseudomonadota bacterium]
MKAILMTSTGPADVLELQDIDEPKVLTDTQIKVQLKGAGVNPIDTKLRNRGLFYPDALPAVLGCDGAGVVVGTGKGVSRFRAGDEVWFCNGGLGGEQGNYAQYTLVDESVAQPKPSSLSFIEAAAAPLILITAWEALFDRAQLKEGNRVLIHAGAGGVGHVAIQLAKITGARVCTTIGSPEKAQFARSLGADETIPYKKT